METSVGVLSLGNVLMGDDAFGPWVVAALHAGWTFPPEVEVRDLGTPGLDLHPHLAAYRVVVLVDTVRGAGAPGTVSRYVREEIVRRPPPARVSPHDPGVKEALLAFDFAGGGPDEVVLIGVVPGKVDYGVGLSEPVRDAIGEAAERVVAELRSLGAEPTPRDRPAPLETWWAS